MQNLSIGKIFFIFVLPAFLVLPAVPVWAMHETRLGYGIIGGMLLEGREHGKQAAELALKVLAGEDPTNIPVVRSRSRPILDFQQLYRFRVPERRNSEAAVIINKPESFWRRYRKVLVPSFLVSGALLSLVIVLVLTVLKLRRTESALRRSETLLNATQRISKVGGWRWTVENRSVIWTKETYRIHEIDPLETEAGSRDLIEKSAACYNPSDRSKVLEAFRNCAERGIPYDLEVPFTTVKGRNLWVRTTARAVRNEKNQIVEVIGNIIDVTDRKQAESQREAALSALAESLANARAIMDASLSGIVLLDR